MPEYRYKVRDKSGKAVNGVIGAKSTEALIEYFKSMYYTPVSIAPIKKSIGFIGVKRKFKTVKLKDVNLFTRQLATFEGAGMPIMTSLRALEGQTEDWRLKEIISQIKQDVEAGSELSEAMARFPDVFSGLYINMVKAGETAGRLREILLRLAELGEKDADTRDKIKAATRYPMIVVIAIVFVFLAIATFILPKFAELFARFNTELPLPTQIMLMINKAFQSYWYLVIVAIFSSIIGFKYAANTRVGRDLIDQFILKVPVFGKVITQAIMARFTRIMGTLLQSGLPILKALEITRDVLGNVIVAKALDEVRESVKEGRGMSGAISANKLFPIMVSHMVAAGEESGALDSLLVKVAEYYDNEVDAAVKNLTVLIEPMLIFFLGGVVLFLALAIFLPMWNMSRVFLK